MYQTPLFADNYGFVKATNPLPYVNVRKIAPNRRNARS